MERTLVPELHWAASCELHCSLHCNYHSLEAEAACIHLQTDLLHCSLQLELSRKDPRLCLVSTEDSILKQVRLSPLLVEDLVEALAPVSEPLEAGMEWAGRRTLEAGMEWAGRRTLEAGSGMMEPSSEAADRMTQVLESSCCWGRRRPEAGKQTEAGMEDLC